MPLPTITIIGNVVADAELRFTNAGKGWVSFTIAANERRKNDAGEWIDGDSAFLDVTSWRSAEEIARQAKRGTRLIVVGTLKQRDYEDKDGNKRKAFQVNADYVATQLREGSDPRAITNNNDTTQPPADNPWAGYPTQTGDETPF